MVSALFSCSSTDNGDVGGAAGSVTASGGSVDLSVKAHDGHFYILAAATAAGRQQIAFTVACGSPLAATSFSCASLLCTYQSSAADSTTDDER